MEIPRPQQPRRALAASLSLLVALGAGACAAGGALPRRPPASSAAAAAAPSSAVAEAPNPTTRQVFVPPVRRERGRLVLPVTFPDGSTAELVSTPKLQLAAMGFQPDVSYLRRDQPAPRFPLSFWFGQPDPGPFQGRQALGRYPTLSGGQAELWRAREASASLPGQGYWLAFRLPSWTVLAPATTPAMAAELVRGLDARETGGGHVVMEVRDPYALAREGGEGGGPQLAVGDASPHPEEVNAGSRFRLITLRPSRDCRPEGISPSGQYASVCLGTAPAGVAVFAGIDGDPSFVREVVAGLRARNVRIAP
jgi:hypothetical protein